MRNAEVINIKKNKKNDDITCICPFCEKENIFVWDKKTTVEEAICWECDMQFLITI